MRCSIDLFSLQADEVSRDDDVKSMAEALKWTEEALQEEKGKNSILREKVGYYMKFCLLVARIR